jgi:hypothetical protein
MVEGIPNITGITADLPTQKRWAIMNRNRRKAKK